MNETGPVLAFQEVLSDNGENTDYPDAQKRTYFAGHCPFCSCSCRLLTKEWIYDTSEQNDKLAVCTNCGWWSYEADQYQDLSSGCYYYSSRAVLQSFDVEDRDVPYDALASYLKKNHEKMVDVHPSKFEELVASVYREVFEYDIEFCSYGRPDRGIDIVCGRHGDGRLFAIQVKRYKTPIKLGQIHQFLGALLTSSYTSGIFVTTSRFQRGCYEVVKESSSLLGVEIDLVDGQQFLEFLEFRNTDANSLYFPDWGRVGYTSNYNLEQRIPMKEILKWPKASGV